MEPVRRHDAMHHHYIDRYAYQDSPIHRLDPRAKVLAVVAYSAVLIISSRQSLPSPWLLLLPGLMLTWGGIPLRFVLKHVAMVSPFILCLVAFSPVYDRVPVQIGGVTVARGWISAVSILARFAMGMGALIALASTTRFPELLKGLERLGVPRLLVMQLRFLYRYLFLLIDQVMHLRLAARARDAGRGPRKWRFRTASATVGVLFVRTLESAERMHLAMVSRGYDGTIRAARPLRWRSGDSLFVSATALYLALICWSEYGRSAGG